MLLHHLGHVLVLHLEHLANKVTRLLKASARDGLEALLEVALDVWLWLLRLLGRYVVAHLAEARCLRVSNRSSERHVIAKGVCLVLLAELVAVGAPTKQHVVALVAFGGESDVCLESYGDLHSSNGDVDAKHVLNLEIAIHRDPILGEIPLDDLVYYDHQVDGNAWYLLLEVPDLGHRFEDLDKVMDGLHVPVELLLVVLNEFLERLVQVRIEDLFRQVVLELEGCEQMRNVHKQLPLLLQDVEAKLDLELEFRLPFPEELVVEHGYVLPQAHQVLQEHHLQRILNLFLLVYLLVQACIAAITLGELGAICDSSKVQANVDHVSELLEHEDLVKEVAGDRHDRPNDEWVLFIQFCLVIRSCSHVLLLQNLQPMVMYLLEDQ